MNKAQWSSGALLCILLLGVTNGATARSHAWRYTSADPGISFEVAGLAASYLSHFVEADFDGGGALDVAACGSFRGGTDGKACAILPSIAAIDAGARVLVGESTATGIRLDTGYLGRELAAGDVNGDGHVDLVATVGSSGFADLLVFFGPFAAGSQVNAADLDGSNGYAVRLAPFTRPGSFGGGLAVLDFDGDAALDIAVGQPDRERVLILRGRAERTATPRLDLLNQEPADVADIVAIGPVSNVSTRLQIHGLPFDDDVLDDLVIADMVTRRIHIIAGTSTPPLTYDLDALPEASGRTLQLAAIPGGIAGGDFNGDGAVDLAISTGDGVQVIFGGQLPGSACAVPGACGYVQSGLPRGYLSAALDMNGDGRDEIVHTPIARGVGPSTVLLGADASGEVPVCTDGDNGLSFLGSSGDVMDLHPMERLKGVGDLDGDGLGDLVHSTDHGSFVIYGKRLKIVFADGMGPCG